MWENYRDDEIQVSQIHCRTVRVGEHDTRFAISTPCAMKLQPFGQWSDHWNCTATLARFRLGDVASPDRPRDLGVRTVSAFPFRLATDSTAVERR